MGLGGRGGGAIVLSLFRQEQRILNNSSLGMHQEMNELLSPLRQLSQVVRKSFGPGPTQATEDG